MPYMQEHLSRTTIIVLHYQNASDLNFTPFAFNISAKYAFTHILITDIALSAGCDQNLRYFVSTDGGCIIGDSFTTRNNNQSTAIIIINIRGTFYILKK